MSRDDYDRYIPIETRRTRARDLADLAVIKAMAAREVHFDRLERARYAAFRCAERGDVDEAIRRLIKARVPKDAVASHLKVSLLRIARATTRETVSTVTRPGWRGPKDRH